MLCGVGVEGASRWYARKSINSKMFLDGLDGSFSRVVDVDVDVCVDVCVCIYVCVVKWDFSFSFL